MAYLILITMFSWFGEKLREARTLRDRRGETGKDALCWERREDHVALVILDEQFYRGFVSSLDLTLLGDLLLTF